MKYDYGVPLFSVWLYSWADRVTQHYACTCLHLIDFSQLKINHDYQKEGRSLMKDGRCTS